MIKECDDFFKLFIKRNTSRLLKKEDKPDPRGVPTRAARVGC